MRVYFSDIFNVKPNIIEKYGAFNISLVNDLPLFVDPFLLFNSKNTEYQKLHQKILKYVAFLRDRSLEKSVNHGLLKSWYCFPEVKQTWLGYSKIGNSGRGPGVEFAKALNDNLSGVFSDFDKQTISQSPHLEKLCLIKDNIGRDNISDFVTNLIKGYLLRYTQAFAQKYIDPARLKSFTVAHVDFNYQTSTWTSVSFQLPAINDDYVLLTPKNLLTKDDTWINKTDLVNQFQDIVSSVSNEQLRSQLNFYFSSNLPKPKKNKDGSDKQPLKRDIISAVGAVIRKYPQFLDYYIKYKEDHGEQAKSVSEERVQEVYNLFVTELSSFIKHLSEKTNFYKKKGDTLAESYERVLFLKNVIENKDGYRLFYVKGEPIKREVDVQIMFRLTWFASPDDVTREANEGRGPVDFKVSRGAFDKTLIEFKLASNTKLAQNLAKQVEIYKKAHDTEKAIKAILFFSADEEAKARKIIADLGLSDEKYIVFIDARRDNKVSASKAL
ncbi:MAG: hypothetical protein JETT_3764 [Candidatus Jettenia ecosi]|uniref:Uncharacterized protein n=1 Tax=Candidatus Jettenia ecosi TaxID=2494326 RepID=A0A533Q771_9BACT|nr:MAG: hypothetical protein JETT_3764 [Candidatus Jettenia ecosi]